MLTWTSKKKKMKLPCSFCDEHFEKHSDLEVHLGIAHSKQKDIQCDTCGKRFLLHWRLEKHKTMHTSSSTIKHCRYYLANKFCYCRNKPQAPWSPLLWISPILILDLKLCYTDAFRRYIFQLLIFLILGQNTHDWSIDKP